MTMKMSLRIQRAAAILLAFGSAGACAKPVDQTALSAQSAAHSPASGVTLQQFEKRHEQRLLAADTDGDGRVSRAEFVAARAGKGDPEKRFSKLDRNSDGMLDRSEIDVVLARRFKRLDTDSNGVASAQERATARAAKGKAARSDSDS